MDARALHVELELLGRLAADRLAGGLAALEHYMALYPDHAELVAREYARAARGMAAAADLEGGGVIGPYRLDRELGRGGQAVVWLAWDERLERRVAVKVVARPLGGEGLSARFRREARATAGLEHPNVCAVYDAGVDGDRAWISMQYVEGETFAAWLARRTSEREGATPTSDDVHAVCVWVADVARALHAAHERGIVHRDVKPGNIMLAENGAPVVLDFGLASLADDGAHLTLSGTTLGTPAYMSPEHIGTSDGRIGAASDVWSLGVVLYEGCVGERPFRSPTHHGLVHAILDDEPTDPRRLSSRISDDLTAILETALAKRPERRYASAQALADDLDRLAAHEPISVRPLGRTQRLARWAQRNPIVAALSVMIVALTLGGLAYVLVTNRELRDTNTRVFEANESLKVKTGEAEANAELAARREAEALAALAEYQRLADARRLQEAEAEAATLLPVHPELVDALLAWQAHYEPLFARTESHRRTLEELRVVAEPYTEAARRVDYAEEDERIARLAAAIRVRTVNREELEHEIEALRAARAERRSWTFDGDLDMQFRHDALSLLVANLNRATAEGGLREDIARRLDLSRRIATETIDAHRAAWEAAAQRVTANERYGDLVLAPQVGLIPLGADPASGLEEFLHWQTHTGALPTRADTGQLDVTIDTGVVLVLVPGGQYRVGAQSADATEPNYDPQTMREEAGPRAITLDPYFLGKFEVTQAQWFSATGENPAAYSPSYGIRSQTGYDINARHPVESIAWSAARDTLHALGLVLPTEAQWEAAARAGTQLRFAGTDAVAELSKFANGLGRESSRFFPSVSPELDDGFSTHAPVGTFLPNAFGFYDMSGNVGEWIRDRFGPYGIDPEPGDGERLAVGETYVLRGGSFTSFLQRLRVASREQAYGPTSGVNAGVRAGRVLDP